MDQRSDYAGAAEMVAVYSRRRHAMAVAAASILGAGVVALGAAWFFRAPLTRALVGQALAAAGIASDFDVARVDFGGLALADVKLGNPERPDAAIRHARIDLAWGPFPRVSAIHLESPTLRARLDASGLSLGQLDALLRTDADRETKGVPDIALEIHDGRGLLETPFGALALTAETQGRLRRDFVGDVRLLQTSARSGANEIRDAAGVLSVRTTPDAVNAVLTLSATAASYEGASLAGLRFDAAFNTDLSLKGAATAQLTTNRLTTTALVLDAMRGDVRLSNADGAWSGDATLTADAADAERAHWRAPRTALRAMMELGGAPSVRGVLQSPHVALTPRGGASLSGAWPSLGAFPIGPLLAAARDGALDLLSDAALNAPFSYDGERFVVESAEIVGADGAAIRMRPRATGRTILVFNREDATWTAEGGIATGGGALPNVQLNLASLTAQAGALNAQAALSIPDYRARNAALQAPSLALTLRHANGRGEARLRGDAVMTGPLGGARIEGLAAPLDLSFGWGEGLRVAPAGERCMDMRFAKLTLPGLTMLDGAAPVCAGDAGFYATNAQGAVSGAFTLAPVEWAGHLGANVAQSARLALGGVEGALGGESRRIALDARVVAPVLDVRFSEERTLRAAAPALDAHLVAAGPEWRATGAVTSAFVEDSGAPAHVRDIAGRWTAAPEGGDVLLRFEAGRARVTSSAQVSPSDRRPAFHPLALTDVTATIADGRVRAEGAVVLEAGARPLGRFAAAHVFDGGAGEATVDASALAFGPSLQPYDISEVARGLIENVRGSVGATIRARWTPDAFAAEGDVALSNVSLSTSTLPIVEGVSGQIRFDNLLALTTLPGQRLSIALLNPGVAVRNGEIGFQLLSDEQVVIERAEWPFAGGVLAVAPTTIALGREETRFTLTLANVDVATLLAEMNVPDLTATGRVGGTFPLVLTREAARVENGRLDAETGGTIAYAGRAGEETQGPARMAFDALKSFRYDNLSLVLNGDLAGDVITEIHFRGASALGVDLAGAGSPVSTEVAGVPFLFNVTVAAPFRSLGRMAASAFDPRQALEQANEARDAEAPAPIDPDAPQER